MFEQTPPNHLSGQGCPKCNESFGEKEIIIFLESNNIKYNKQHKFDGCINKYRLPFDFYLQDHKTCIEYDGKQHSNIIEFWGGKESFEKIKLRDNIKTEYCKNNNINLLRINYSEDISEKLYDYFKF